jgi:hypothetical protein
MGTLHVVFIGSEPRLSCSGCESSVPVIAARSGACSVCRIRFGVVELLLASGVVRQSLGRPCESPNLASPSPIDGVLRSLSTRLSP